jgi:hypothetical protein
MPPGTRSTLKLCLAVTASASFVGVGPAFSADQGSVQIMAIAPAFCRIAARPYGDVGTVGRACNTVNDARITARVSNLDGASLELDGVNIAVSANGMATLSAQQLAGLADLHVANARPVNARAPIAVELTVTPQ